MRSIAMSRATRNRQSPISAFTLAKSETSDLARASREGVPGPRNQTTPLPIPPPGPLRMFPIWTNDQWPNSGTPEFGWGEGAERGSVGNEYDRPALAARSRRPQPEPFVPAAEPGDERDRGQHHPGLADDLAGQELERAEREPQEHHGIDDESGEAGGTAGGNEPPPRQRRIDRKIGEFREQERDRGCQDERRRRKQRGERRAGQYRERRDRDAH